MKWARVLRWGEYVACAVLVCVVSEIAFERWVIADVVGPIVADVPRPEPLPGHVATRMQVFFAPQVGATANVAPVLRWFLRALTRGRHTHCPTSDGMLAKELVFHHAEREKVSVDSVREFLTFHWLAMALTTDERVALHAQEGWFGAGNLRESAARLLGKELDDLTSGELAFLLAWNDLGGSARQNIRRLARRRAYVLNEFLNAGVIGSAEFEAETESGGLPESLASKVLTCPKPPECSPTDAI